MAASEREAAEPRRSRIGNWLLITAEDIIYVGIAILLTFSGIVLLINAASTFTDLGDAEPSEVVLEVLDRLLLVFIVVELLFAVRVILRKRELVAEPFLVVGIIASIKEIIVLSVEAADLIGKGKSFEHAMWEVAILGVLVVLLAGSAVLLRLKEREPEEGEEGGQTG